jgi:hypothetical protein
VPLAAAAAAAATRHAAAWAARSDNVVPFLAACEDFRLTAWRRPRRRPRRVVLLVSLVLQPLEGLLEALQVDLVVAQGDLAALVQKDAVEEKKKAKNQQEK